MGEQVGDNVADKRNFRPFTPGSFWWDDAIYISIPRGLSSHKISATMLHMCNIYLKIMFFLEMMMNHEIHVIWYRISTDKSYNSTYVHKVVCWVWLIDPYG